MNWECNVYLTKQTALKFSKLFRCSASALPGERVKRLSPFRMYPGAAKHFVAGNIWLASYGLSGQSSDEIYHKYKIFVTNEEI